MIQALRPSPGWLWFQSEEPWTAPQALLDIPGISFGEPFPTKPCWRLRIPHTTWMLQPVRDFIEQFMPVPGLVRDASAVALPDVPLYAHQQAGIRYVLSRGSALIGDQMGLGKTRTALTTAHMLTVAGTQPTLIVGPKSVRHVWRKEIETLKLDPEGWHAIESVTPDIASLQRKRWLFCHPDILHAWWSQIYSMRPAVAILDEAHLFRNGSTRRGKAAKLALSGVPHRIVLTGTPLPNRVGDIWQLLEMTSGRFSWGSPREFRVRYAGASTNGWGGLVDGHPTEQEELHERLAHLYIRRTVQGVGLDLPSLTRQTVEVDADLAKYHEMFDGYDVDQVLKAVLQRRASKKTITWLGRLRKLTSKMKVEATANEVSAALEADESIVVFTWERATANKLAGWFAEGGKRHVAGSVAYAVTGAMPQVGRDAVVDAFQQARWGVHPRPGPAVIFATLGALSVGVTLTRARIVLMHDLDFVPSEMLQAEARVRRIGQDRPVISKWMVARGTLDEMLVKIIRSKADVLEVGGDQEGHELAALLDQDWLRSEVSAFKRWLGR